jgi:DNA end-binding protein Ku
MKAIWKGALSFGLVHIPVRLYPAISRGEIHFRLLHKECRSPVRFKRFCPACNRDLEEEEIIRGYEYQRGKFVLLEGEELSAAISRRDNIQIQSFHNLSEVDPIYFDKTYYLEAQEGGQRAYSLLREALAQRNTVALALFQLRTKDSLCLVRPFAHNLLALTTVFYADEVRSIEEFSSGRIQAEPQELAMANTLIENLTAPFQLEKYSDQKQQAMEKLIEEKLKGEELTEAPVPATGQVIDLVEALKASVEATGKPKRARKKA